MKKISLKIQKLRVEILFQTTLKIINVNTDNFIIKLNINRKMCRQYDSIKIAN